MKGEGGTGYCWRLSQSWVTRLEQPNIYKHLFFFERLDLLSLDIWVGLEKLEWPSDKTNNVCIFLFNLNILIRREKRISRGEILLKSKSKTFEIFPLLRGQSSVCVSLFKFIGQVVTAQAGLITCTALFCRLLPNSKLWQISKLFNFFLEILMVHVNKQRLIKL